MSFYELPDSLDSDIKNFDEHIQKFKGAKINPAEFRSNRVPHGIYEQRTPNTYMFRIRCPSGAITPKQLRVVTQLSKKFGADFFHITTRQETQLQYVSLDNLIEIYSELRKVNLSSRGGGGNTVRNIIASYDSGVLHGEVFDVAPYAMALTTRLIAEKDSWMLPRKFKIAFSNTPLDKITATITDVGFIAKIKNGKKGFKVFCAGSMGAIPRVGKILFEFVDEDQVYYIVRAMKELFDQHGNRRNKHRNRLKFLWEKLGEEEFKKLFQQYYDELRKTDDLELRLPKIVNKAEVKKGYLPEVPKNKLNFEIWKKRNTTKQKQYGLVQIRVPLIEGDIINEDGDKLADFLENFGQNCIRLSIQQNLYLRNIPDAYLGNVFNFISELKTFSEKPEIIGNMIACTGADTCTLGICLSRGLTKEIQRKLLSSSIDLEQFNDTNINISGCPNACGSHFIGDIGLFGRVGKKNQHQFPSYVLMTGLEITEKGTVYSEKREELPAKFIPDVIVGLFREFQDQTEIGSFKDYLKSESCKSYICQQRQEFLKQIPSYDEDETFYYDFGEQKPFTILKGQISECSAGLFDMIDVDFAAMGELNAKLYEGGLLFEDQIESIYKLVMHSCRSLLIAKGVEPKNERDIFVQFYELFVFDGLVPESFLDLIRLCEKGERGKLIERQSEAQKLSKHMRKLYASMDDSLRFQVPKNKKHQGKEVQATDSKASSKDKVVEHIKIINGNEYQVDVFKDLRNIKCPMNFVKTKIALNPMRPGQLLEILIDDGAPKENVPVSVRLEGHEVLFENQLKDTSWSVLIQKT
ncbi:MAG: sulfurtransferase TusA family protein [Deltaproteobacteria bacterium]|nr:sulfurtransferase TusA family protein [Deltaproteobacteria bacterium]